jgi:integrase
MLCNVMADPAVERSERLAAEAKCRELLRSTIKLRQRQFLVTRDSLLSELWAEVAPLLADLKASTDTMQEYRHAVGQWCTVWERLCGAELSIGCCEAEPGSLDLFQAHLADLPSRWHKKRADAGETLSTYTRRRTCRRIVSLFRLAGPPDQSHKLYRHALGVLDVPPRFSEAVELSPTPPVALLPDQLRELIGYLSESNAVRIKRPSCWPDVPAWRFWRTYVLTAVYEGLRPAELFRLEWAWIKRGRIEVPASARVNRKQNRWISRRLHPVAASELEAIRTDRKYLFRWAENLKYCERVASDVLREAIPAETWQLGKGLYVLRKTHMTQLEMARTGAGQQSAGHASGKTTADSYLDPRQTDADIDRMPDWLAVA